ncbi:MAG: hypothetical protein LBJ97_02905 [Mycoplasmataceae bacterium]|jgi:hypothetical protein|nr:hypothetical protein [Mycoplasmataceae bacterium]
MEIVTSSTNYQITKSDHDPVKRGDNITLTRKKKPRGPGLDVIIDKPPRMTLNKLAEIFVEFRDEQREQNTQVNTRFDKIESRLDGHDEFNKVVKDYNGISSLNSQFKNKLF